MKANFKIKPGKIFVAAFYFLVFPILLFAVSGNLRWTTAWIYLGLSYLAMILSRVLLAKIHPDLLKERAGYMEKQDEKTWDRVLSPLVGLWIPLAYFFVAGLDHRLGWTTPLPIWITLPAWFITIIAFALTTWAMIENRFFSAVVRIQQDRGHFVVDSGPYQIVRHPGYTGGFLVAVMFPLVLEALWAFIPVIIYVFVLALRTAREDRTLTEELDGYAAYTRKTRFRLLPGIW